ncbi:MAG: hypothetical protein L3J28_13845 [Candidatus Polarisedimenticolaceae bacterium]|nr:hypothetical protein [Candidatus Polarisedimenticolaceae bacterium]
MQTGNQADKSAMQEKMMRMHEQSASSGEDAQLSPMGQMMSMLSSMDSEGLEQMRDFRGEVSAAVKSGEFDAEALAGEAPGELKAFAEENGVDLTAMVTQMADRAEQGGMMKGGGHGMNQGGGMNAFVQSDQGLSDLLETLLADNGEEDEA